VNEPFDPSRHEAVATMPDADAKPGTVLHVVRPGYGSDERPLRPAAVIVAKGT
jgi:molecular chaperone GrpE